MKKLTMIRPIGVAMVAVTLIFAGASPVLAQAATTTTNTTLPLDLTLRVPCANGGAGEDVHFTGYIHIVFHTTRDAGGPHLKEQTNLRGVKGTGLMTGDTYVGIESVSTVEYLGEVGSTHTVVDNLRLIGLGTGNKLLLQVHFHTTVNANGKVTAVIENIAGTCN